MEDGMEKWDITLRRTAIDSALPFTAVLVILAQSRVFQHLPEPNRACPVGVHAVTLDPLRSLYGIIYVTWYTRHLPKATMQSQIPVAFGIPDHLTYQTPTRHALLGSIW